MRRGGVHPPPHYRTNILYYLLIIDVGIYFIHFFSNLTYTPHYEILRITVIVINCAISATQNIFCQYNFYINNICRKIIIYLYEVSIYYVVYEFVNVRVMAKLCNIVFNIYNLYLMYPFVILIT